MTEREKLEAEIAGYDAQIENLKGGHIEKGLTSAKEVGKSAGRENGLRNYIAMIPRALATGAGYASDFVNIPTYAMGWLAHKAAGVPYQEHPGHSEQLKQMFDKLTKNYGKPNTEHERLGEVLLESGLSGPIKAGTTAAKVIGKTIASRIPAVTGAAIGEATDSPFLAGIGIPLAVGTVKGYGKHWLHKARLGKIKHVEDKIIQDISKKSAHEFSPYTHEVAGHPLSLQEILANVRAKKEKTNALTEALNKTRNNQKITVQQNRAAQKKARQFKKENEEKFYTPKETKELEHTYQTQAEPLGEKLYNAVTKKQEALDVEHATMFGKTKQDVANIPKGHTEDLTHLAKEAYAELDGITNNQVLKDAVNTQKAKTVFKLMGVDPTGKSPETLKLHLKLASEGHIPVTASIEELNRIGKNTKIRESEFNVTSPEQVGETKHILKNIGAAKKAALEHVPGAPARKAEAGETYGVHMKTVRPHHDVTTIEGKHLPETALAHSIEKAAEGKGHHKVKAIADALGKETGAEWVKYRIAKMANKNNKYDEKTLVNNFLGLAPSEQRAMVEAADPRTAAVLNNYMHHGETLEKVRTPSKTNFLTKEERNARVKAKTELALHEATPVEKSSPADLFRSHQKDILAGRAAPSHSATARGTIRDIGQGKSGEFDISQLRSAKNIMQPEAWARIKAKLPSHVVRQVESDISELSFLDNMVKRPAHAEVAGEALKVVSPKAGKIANYFKKRANTEKAYSKIKQAYEHERLGTKPNFFIKNEKYLGRPGISILPRPKYEDDEAKLRTEIEDLDRQIAALSG
jgi:hypothetical protein